MRYPGAVLLLGLLAAASPARAQELPRSDVDGILAKVDGPGRDLAAVSLHALNVDARLTDLLLAIARKFSLRYSIPAQADPVAVLRGLCPKCAPTDLLRAGYTALESRMARLRGYLDGSTALNAPALQSLVNQTVLLAWALKGYALLEAVGFRDGGTVAADGTVRGSSGSIPGWPGAAALLGGTGVAGHLERMMDRRRQAEAAGLNYPNANIDTWLLCFRNCGS